METASSEPPSLMIAGPTGVGKTEVAIGLARRGPWEMLSADSMQIYRGMAIGTAQPRPEELAGLSIRLCGTLDPREPFNVKKFVEAEDRARAEILAAGRRPLHVGGTGMYLRALRWGLFEEPILPEAERKAETRARLEEEFERDEAGAMHARLAALDPRLAGRIGPRDGVRIVRALEVLERTGRRLEDLRVRWTDARPRFPHALIVLHAPREVLVRRIDRRVDAMFAAGWADEVRALLDDGVGPGSPSFRAIGYREIAEMLAGRATEAATRERIKAATRQFARRQMTWFRKERDAIWLPHDGEAAEKAVLAIERIADAPPRAAPPGFRFEPDEG